MYVVEQFNNQIRVTVRLIERQSLDLPEGFLLFEKKLSNTDYDQKLYEYGEVRYENEYVVILRSRFMNDTNKEEIMDVGEKWAKEKSVERQVMQSENDNSMKRRVVPGSTWKHCNTFGVYEVLQIVEDASRHEEGKVVIYCNVKDCQKVFARPLAEWFNNVRRESGVYGHRFEEVARLRDGYVFHVPIKNYIVPEYDGEKELMKTSITHNENDPNVLEIEVVCSLDQKEYWQERVARLREYLDQISQAQMEAQSKPIPQYLPASEEVDAHKSR